jgi:hypothetical protein
MLPSLLLLCLSVAPASGQQTPAEKNQPATKRPLPPEARAEMQKHGHGEGTLKPGDMAVDFDLKRLTSSERVSLSSFRGKMPVALVFGSYT